MMCDKDNDRKVANVTDPLELNEDSVTRANDDPGDHVV